MKYSWTTARGAKIDLDIDVKIIAEETLWNDGNEITVPCRKWQYTINSLLVNGREMKAGAYKQQIGRWPESVLTRRLKSKKSLLLGKNTKSITTP